MKTVKWRWLFTPQATSLLLVVAVILLAVVTLQTRTAAVAAKTNTIENRTIITGQQAQDRRAALLAQEQAVASARLAASSIKEVLANTTARSDTSDAKTATLIKRLQAQLLVALSQLQASLDQLNVLIRAIPRGAEDPYQPPPKSSPAPVPVPTCLPLVSCHLLR